MASDPPPFQVEDNTDEDFFDKLVNDDDDMDFKVVSESASAAPDFSNWNESDEAKAFANLSINDLDNNIEVNSNQVSTAIHDNIDLGTETKEVEQIGDVGTVERSGIPLASSNSLDELDNEHGGVESLSDRTVVSKSSGESLSETTMDGKTSAVSGAPGVKEVDWSAFHADLSQNGGNGFGSYSDFFNELGGGNDAGDAFGNVGANNMINGVQYYSGTDVQGLGNAETSNNYGHYTEGSTHSIAADHTSESQDMNNSHLWENQYPGWKFDASTGQWYEVDVVPDVQASVSSNLSSDWESQAEVSYLQQTSQSVAGTIADTGSTQNVTNWSQATQGNDATGNITDWNQFSQLGGDATGVSTDLNQASQGTNGGYPPHMVFDPQYPGWYYDTITQNWHSLESYNLSAQATTEVQHQTGHDEYVSADSFSQNNDQKTQSVNDHSNRYIPQDINSQSQDQNWVGSISNYNQQIPSMWEPGIPDSNQAVQSYNGNQMTETHYEPKEISSQSQDQNWGGSVGYYNQQNPSMWQPGTPASNQTAKSYSGNQITEKNYEQKDINSQSQDQNWVGSSNTYNQQTPSMWQPGTPVSDQAAQSYSGNQITEKLYEQKNISSQNQGQNWVGSMSKYNQQTSSVWQPGTPVSSQAAKSYSGNQITEKHYEQNASAETSGSRQTFSNYSGSDSYYENVNQLQGNYSVSSGSKGYSIGKNLSQTFNDQNDQKHVSTGYPSNQNSFSLSQHEFKGTQVSYNPAAGRSSAGRPAHALVAFGFGGKLIVMKDNSSSLNLSFGSQNSVGGSISVINLAEVVSNNVDASNKGMGVSNYFQALCRQPLPGPLAGGSIGTKELNKWIDERIANPDSTGTDYRKAEGLRLLLSLLKIACQYYGKLRSPYGTDVVLMENDSPESAVAKLFAAARRNGVQSSQYASVAQCLQQLPSEGQMRVTANEVQSLLASGRKKEALECAQEGQLWGPALVLATQLGDQFYVETVKQMALRHLVAGSPLRTLCLLIAGQPADVFSADNTAVSSIAGTAYSPQQPSQVGANGMLDDWEENLAVITANRTKDDEFVLMHLGDCLWKDRSDIIAAHICYLVAETNIEPYSDSARLCLVGSDHWKFPRTYASPEAIQRTELYEYTKTLGNSQFVLLPFQPYKLVYAHMLAEVGRIPDALKYCQAVLRSLKTGRAPEVEYLRHLVSSFEERIKAHQQGGFSTNLVPKKLVGKLLNLFDSTAHRVVGGLPPPVPASGGTIQGTENYHQSVAPRVSTSQSTMAMSSLVPSQSMEPINEWANDSNKVGKHARSASEPDFSSTPRQDKGSAGGVTSRFGGFGFGAQLLQKTVGLVLKPRQGRQAKLGDTNKFYYDEKLKRWVEEGAEPPAQEAALPPPPKSTVIQNGTPDYNLKSALRNEAAHSNGTSEFKSTSAADNGPGMPPLPPTSNLFSTRGRMGVRSRYVDTFNKGGAHATNSFQSPSVPSVKPMTGANPKFFVPTPLSGVEQPVDAPVNSMQDTLSTHENNIGSPSNDPFQSPSQPAFATMPRFASMNSITAKGASDSGSFSVHSRRTASWSGSMNDSFSPPNRSEVKPLGEVLGMPPSSFMPNDPSLLPSSMMNGSSFGDELHEVEL